jgi:hypothetical protein
MKWKDKKIHKKRNKTRFLVFPKWIHGETRWLETATWEERHDDYPGFIGYRATKWIKDK